MRIKAALLNILGILAEHAQLASNEPVRNPRVELLKTVISHIRQNYQHPLSLGELAALAGMNEQYFCRFFKKSLGKTPVSYINDFRIRHADVYKRQAFDLPYLDAKKISSAPGRNSAEKIPAVKNPITTASKSR